MGTEPQATFSACFGGPFLAMHPYAYAEMLAAKLEKVGGHAWLLNTGWVGGKYGEGERCPLKYTRMIVDAVHDGSLAAIKEWAPMDRFGLLVPKGKVKDVPEEVLHPKIAWMKNDPTTGSRRYDADLDKLAELFNTNFVQYADKCSPGVVNAGSGQTRNAPTVIGGYPVKGQPEPEPLRTMVGA